MGITVFRTGGAKRLFMPSMGISVVEPIGGAAPAWVPTDIPGCVLWLDASAITGLLDGDLVGTWSDLSGGGKDVTQTTTAKKPTYKTGVLNGLPVVRFDGGDVLNGTGTVMTGKTAGTMFVVVTVNANKNYSVYETLDGDGYWHFVSAHAGYFAVFCSARITAYPSVMPTSGSHVFSIVAGATYTVYQNGNSLGAATSYTYNAGTVSVVGANEYLARDKYLTGDIAELLVYGSALGDVDRGIVEDYLGAKWGIAVA